MSKCIFFKPILILVIFFFIPSNLSENQNKNEQDIITNQIYENSLSQSTDSFLANTQRWVSDNNFISSMIYFYPSLLYGASYYSLNNLSQFQKELLTQQNVYRAQGNLSPLIWDNTLESYIHNYMNEQSRYNNCEFQHSPSADRDIVGSFENIGENLYMSWGFTPTGYRVANKWFEEILCYRYGPTSDPCTYYASSSCNMSPIMVGHFTQMMWENATHIGCDWKTCESCSQNCPRIYVGCVYGSRKQSYGGNVIGWYPFQPTTAALLKIQNCPTRDIPTNSNTTKKLKTDPSGILIDMDP